MRGSGRSRTHRVAAPLAGTMIRSSAVMRLQLLTREIEVASLLALVAAMLVPAAASLSVLWFGRIG